MAQDLQQALQYLGEESTFGLLMGKSVFKCIMSQDLQQALQFLGEESTCLFMGKSVFLNVYLALTGAACREPEQNFHLLQFIFFQLSHICEAPGIFAYNSVKLILMIFVVITKEEDAYAC
jgi:hypothetical protein